MRVRIPPARHSKKIEINVLPQTKEEERQAPAPVRESGHQSQEETRPESPARQGVFAIHPAAGQFWWLPLPILQNTILIAVNQPLADFCFVTQNQRGTKTGQNHGKIKSRTLRPKYPLWNTSVSFAKVQICPLKNEGKSLFLSFTTHFPTIVPQMWLLQTVLTSNSMTCENRVLNFVLHSDGHFQKRELAIEPNICHPYCPIFGFVIV